MNILFFSTNPEARLHILNEFSNNQLSVQNFSELNQLSSALEKEQTVQLVYHLGLRKNDENELASIQTKFKQKLKTLVLTNSPNSDQGVRLLNLNVRGYANTYISDDKLMMALSVIDQGEIWAGAALIQHLLINSRSSDEETTDKQSGGLSGHNNSIFHQLTIREQEIAQNILKGLQNKIIASDLHITERTVKAHLSTIFKKLGVRNRLELTLKLQQADRRTDS